MKGGNMLAQIETILCENTLCVLCTETAGNPYCSLMTYLLMDDDISVLYLVATRDSRKYQNLLANPRVSVLVDTRQTQGAATTEKIVSVTFSGLFKALTDCEAQRIKLKLATEHLELAEILKNPNSVVFGIQLKSFLLLDGPVDSYRGDL